MPVLLTQKPVHCPTVCLLDKVLCPLISSWCDFRWPAREQGGSGTPVPTLIWRLVILAELWKPLEGKEHTPPLPGAGASSGHVSCSNRTRWGPARQACQHAHFLPFRLRCHPAVCGSPALHLWVPGMPIQTPPGLQHSAEGGRACVCRGWACGCDPGPLPGTTSVPRGAPSRPPGGP